MADKIDITINGQPHQLKPGAFLLAALQEAGVAVPTLCHHKDLTPHGSCRLCMVEVEESGRTRLVTACNYPVRGPLTVTTTSERVTRHRRVVAEMLLSRWPKVPIIQQVAKTCGVTSTRFTHDFADDNPKACVLCGRCSRACKEFMLEDILGFAGRGMLRHMVMPFNEMDRHCVGCNSCAYVCPTGAITIAEDYNHPVDRIKIRNHGMKVNAEMATLDNGLFRIRQLGTANIVETMDKYDLLPVHNYKFGRHPDTAKVGAAVLRSRITQGAADACCRGCSMACAKVVDNFELKTGPYAGHKVVVDGPEYETAGGSTNMGCFDPDFIFEMNFYCDTYGIDTISYCTTMAFVMECFEAGVITEKHTGGLKLNFGATAASLEILHQMARGQGFGVDVGQGTRWLKRKWAAEYGADPTFLDDIAMESKGLEVSEYMTKESVAQQAGYGLTNKGPQHDEAWLIFMDQVNNQIPTFQDKAEALYWFPLWRTWFGLQGLCKIVWNDIVPANNKFEKEAHKIPDHVRNYERYFEGMTGKTMNEAEILKQSERVYQLQRVMTRLLGFGTREHDRMPYRAMGPVTAEEYESRQERYDKQLKEKIGVDPVGKTTAEKMALVRKYREEQYRLVTDAVYQRRGWTKNGVPTVARLKELGIDLPELVKIIEKDQEK